MGFAGALRCLLGHYGNKQDLATVTGYKQLAGEEVDVVNDFLNEEFREIDDDMVVRSKFKADDLRLLRRAFIGYIRSGVARSDESKCRDLFKRMLRREGK